MRRAVLGMVALLAFGLSGCFMFNSTNGFWPSRTRTPDSTPQTDIVVMQVSVLEVPVGDTFANKEVWTTVDEQIESIPPELRKNLEENGLRVGLVGARTPDGLLDLLTSKRSNSGATETYRLSYEHPFGPRIPRCEFPLHYVDRDDETVAFDQAQFKFKLTRSLAADGKIRIQFTPEVEFHDPKKWSRLNPVVPLAVQGQRTTEPISTLQFDVNLGEKEYLVVGARLDHPKSLGVKFLVTPDVDRPVQRLIAIRAGRIASAADAPGPSRRR